MSSNKESNELERVMRELRVYYPSQTLTPQPKQPLIQPIPPSSKWPLSVKVAMWACALRLAWPIIKGIAAIALVTLFIAGALWIYSNYTSYQNRYPQTYRTQQYSDPVPAPYPTPSNDQQVVQDDTPAPRAELVQTPVPRASLVRLPNKKTIVHE
jgi:hypothetical protein